MTSLSIRVRNRLWNCSRYFKNYLLTWSFWLKHALEWL